MPIDGGRSAFMTSLTLYSGSASAVLDEFEDGDVHGRLHRKARVKPPPAILEAKAAAQAAARSKNTGSKGFKMSLSLPALGPNRRSKSSPPARSRSPGGELKRRQERRLPTMPAWNGTSGGDAIGGQSSPRTEVLVSEVQKAGQMTRMAHQQLREARRKNS
jgi:hypothetical protein